ncbi:MAG TPA: methyltransferase domain-containing protein [Burkholderiaceae bacterium]|nr:methyltransferase domain-containing protein [Burkholderiaceae bacterium]
MAQQVPLLDDGLVIELGGGTGAVTQAILDQGIDPSRLMVVEYSRSFVQRLRTRFAHINVIHGNAADLSQFVPPGQRVSAIVSSLPLCSLPAPVTQQILGQWQTLLADGGVAVQFTYHLRTPRWREHVAHVHARSKIIWANVPPAKVTTFSFDATSIAHPAP